MNKATASGPHFPDLSRAPFAITDASPAQAAKEIVASFRQLALLEERTTTAFAAVAERTGLASSAPIVSAGRTLAAEMDADWRGIGRNPYHNSQHTCEVLLCSHYVAKRHRLAPGIIGQIALAALIHDFGHDGTNNGAEPFRLERHALESTRGPLLAAGVAPAEADRIAAMVLSTELQMGTPYARSCLRRFRNPDAPPPSAAPLPGPLGLLADDADLAFQAVLLTECDLLPSVALTIDHAMTNQVRLSREDRRIVAGPGAKRAFLERHVEDLMVADFFQPNLKRLRRFVNDSLDTQGAR